MGVSTNCNISFYSSDKSRIQKVELDDRADAYIYDLINDGGSEFNPDKIFQFTAEEKEIMKIYFDENSGSEMEGYATVQENIQHPKSLKKIWVKIRQGLIRKFENMMKEYHDRLAQDGSVKLSEYDFEKRIFNYTWSLDSVSGILSLLQFAILKEYLVEITVSDF